MAERQANALKSWIRFSREQERRSPERYISYYVDRVNCDDTFARMTQETYDEIESNCGRYDGTTPTGEYCGKMFVRGDRLVWYGISKANPLTHVAWNVRKVLITD